MDDMIISKFLSKVIGFYEMIISIVLFFNMPQFAASIDALLDDDPLMLFIGCVTVIIGLLMVVSHNIWQWNWRVLVTIVAWIVLVKGLTILLFPHALDELTIQFASNTNFAYGVAGFEFLFGLMLCFYGFKDE